MLYVNHLRGRAIYENRSLIWTYIVIGRSDRGLTHVPVNLGLFKFIAFLI